jgi:excisionase family DNA binding protein
MNANGKTEVLLIKPAQAAAMLGVGRTKLYSLIQTGEIPVVQLGGAIRIPLAALRKLASSASAESDGSGGEAA